MLISLAFKNKAFTYRKIQLGVYFNLLKSSSSVGSGMLFAHVIQLLPPIVIGIFLSTSDAGLYGAAYRLILIGMLLDRLFVQLLIPNLSKQWSENKELTLTNMEHISRIMLSLGAIVSVFIAIGASDISSLLFGDEFVNSAPIIIALSLYLFITFQNSMFSHGLVAIGKDVQFLKATSISGVIAILLIVSSSIYFNSMFVGLAVAISELCITFMCYYWFKKSLSFNYVTPFFFTLIIGIGIYFGSTFIHLIPIVEALLATIVLGIVLLSFRVLRLQDLRWLKVILIR
jgi:O-antigen/teichoic acid export membrane protein